MQGDDGFYEPLVTFPFIADGFDKSCSSIYYTNHGV